MKKTISILLVFVLSVFIMTSYAFAGTEALNSPSDILVLGDSISSGYGLDNYSSGRENTNNYANLVSEHYGIKDKLTNLAIDGQTSAELYEKIQNGEYDGVLKNADCVITSIGGNDLLHYVLEVICQALGIEGMKEFSSVDFTNPTVMLNAVTVLSGEETQARFDEIVTDYDTYFQKIYTLLREKAPDANIIFLTIYNPFDQNSYFSLINTLAADVLEQLNSVVRTNSVDESGKELYRFADLYAGFAGYGSDLTNIEFYDIHPSSAGHEQIAELLKPLIEDFEYKAETVSADVEGLRQKAFVLCVILSIILLAIILFFSYRFHKNYTRVKKDPPDILNMNLK